MTQGQVYISSGIWLEAPSSFPLLIISTRRVPLVLSASVTINRSHCHQDYHQTMNSHDDDLSTFPIDMENLVDTSKDEMSEELMIKVYSDLHSNIEFFISEIWGANMYTIGGLWLEQAQQYLLPAMRQDPSVLERLGALYVVKRVVWVLALQHQLDQHIFDQTYPLGVTAEQEKLFDEAPQTTTGDAVRYHVGPYSYHAITNIFG